MLVPFLKKGHLISYVGKSGFKLPGKEGETNILTGDKIISFSPSWREKNFSQSPLLLKLKSGKSFSMIDQHKHL